MPPFPGPPVASPDASGAIPVAIQGPGGIQGTPLGFGTEAITTGAAVALPAIPAGTIYAIVSCSLAALWRDDGVAPTTTVGVAMVAGTPYTFSGAQLATLKFILAAAGPGVLNASFYGE